MSVIFIKPVLALVVGLLLLFVVGCKKDKTIAPDLPIAGFEDGEYVSFIFNKDPDRWTFYIKQDGTITTEATALGIKHFAVGTGALTSDFLFSGMIKTLYGIYSNVSAKQRLTALYNRKKRTLTSGKWLNITWGNDSGYVAAKYVR